uniref:Actin binding LIM protein 1b n=1 Tax=Echeneis naucrates TaxID=173247 RepID=A0A665V4G2_ECHNA
SPERLPYHDGCHPCSPAGKRVIQCFRCGGQCKGEVLRVQSNHFHIKCFTCKVCGCDLAQSGFFMRNGDYLCPVDFQRLHGTLCNNCGEFVEGEVVTVLGKTYHPRCFVCTILVSVPFSVDQAAFPCWGLCDLQWKRLPVSALCSTCVSYSQRHQILQ